MRTYTLYTRGEQLKVDFLNFFFSENAFFSIKIVEKEYHFNMLSVPSLNL